MVALAKPALSSVLLSSTSLVSISHRGRAPCSASSHTPFSCFFYGLSQKHRQRRAFPASTKPTTTSKTKKTSQNSSSSLRSRYSRKSISRTSAFASPSTLFSSFPAQTASSRTSTAYSRTQASHCAPVPQQPFR